MAKLNKKQTELMVSLVAATLSDAQCLYVQGADVEALKKAGYAEQNPEMVNADGVATRATPAGIEAFPVGMTESGAVAGSGAVATSKPSFAIAEIPMPGHKRTGGGRTGSSYPFDDLAVGQAFFVAATAERPDPARQLGSTVTGANERHSEVIEGETRVNRKGREVPVTRPLRKFEIRALEDGAAFGPEFAGVKGAGIWRTL